MHTIMIYTIRETIAESDEELSYMFTGDMSQAIRAAIDAQKSKDSKLSIECPAGRPIAIRECGMWNVECGVWRKV